MAIKHGNGKDWWLLVRKYYSNKFYKILINSSGIQTPTIQYLGIPYFQTISVTGGSSINLTGTKLSYVYVGGWNTSNIDPNQLDLYDFDRCTGTLNNYKQLFVQNNTIDTFYWNLSCFSPNGRFLYVSNAFKIWQLDLNATDIFNSRILVNRRSIAPNSYCLMKIGADSKIYISPYGSSNYINVINYPDSLGLACNIVENALNFGGNGHWAEGGLPNVPNFALGAIAPCGMGINEIKEENNGWQIYPNPASSVIGIRLSVGSLKTAAVIDLQGRKFENLKMSKFENEIRIEVSNLSSGIYFIKITDDKGNVSTKKFVKE